MRYFSILLLAAALVLPACGDRFNIDTEHGRQAVIDEANLYLSNGNCQLALNAIEPLYNSAHVTDEVRVIRASADACFAGFATISLLKNITDKTNFYEALAKTMNDVTFGGGKLPALYRATDIITSNGAKLAAIQRSRELNDFMVFLQLAVMGAIQDLYGGGTAEGVQSQTFNYLAAGAGTLSNTDGCAYAGAVGFISDSFNNSNLSSNTQATTAIARLNSLCAAAGISSCASLNKNRTACDGANAESVAADAIVDQANAAW